MKNWHRSPCGRPRTPLVRQEVRLKGSYDVTEYKDHELACQVSVGRELWDLGQWTPPRPPAKPSLRDHVRAWFRQRRLRV